MTQDDYNINFILHRIIDDRGLSAPSRMFLSAALENLEGRRFDEAAAAAKLGADYASDRETRELHHLVLATAQFCIGAPGFPEMRDKARNLAHLSARNLDLLPEGPPANVGVAYAVLGWMYEMEVWINAHLIVGWRSMNSDLARSQTFRCRYMAVANLRKAMRVYAEQGDRDAYHLARTLKETLEQKGLQEATRAGIGEIVEQIPASSNVGVKE